MSNFPHHLVVIHDFENYRRGDKITDDGECQRVIDGENAHHCHRVQKDERPQATTSPKAKAAD